MHPRWSQRFFPGRLNQAFWSFFLLAPAVFRLVLGALIVQLALPQAHSAVHATITVDSGEILEGDDIALTVIVVPAGTYRYQWYFQGTPLLGRTTPILRLQNVQVSEGGSYSATVTSSTDNIPTPVTNITIWSYPKLAINGQTNVVTEASLSRFEVLPLYPDGGFSFQWYFNDQPLRSETNSFLKFEGATFDQSGFYSVTVSNLHAAVVSNPYVLQVMPRDGLERWEWRYPPVQGNDLSQVAFGAGIFVAVGSGGALLTSQDGLEWINRHEERFGDLQSITYGDAGFVAVGTPGRLIRSPDGTNWTVLPQAEVTSPRVTFGNGIYLVAGSGPLGFTSYLSSSDGVNWERHISPNGRSISDFTFGNGRFVARGNVTLVSTNGLEWEERATLTGLFGFGNGVFISLRGFTTISTNGLDWSRGGDKAYEFDDVTGGNGVFVAVTSAGEVHNDHPAQRIYNSTDGLHWTTNSLVVSNNLHRVSFAGGLFFALGDDGVFLVSTNGLAWQSLSGWDDVNFNAAVASPGKRIAVGDQGRIVLAESGSPWRVIASDLTNSLKGIAFGAGHFVVIDSSGAISVSTNGESWHLAYSQTSRLRGIAYGAGRFVAVGDHSSVIASTNGTMWESIDYPLVDNEGAALFGNIQSITFTGKEFLAVDGNIGRSKNGILYQRFVTPPLAEIAFGNGVYVGIGTNGIFISPDLISWKPALTKPEVKTRNLIFGDGYFLLAGSDGNVYASSNGDYWLRHYISSQNELRALAAAQDGTLIAVGNNGVILESPLPLETIRASLTAPDELLLSIVGLPRTTYRLQRTSSLPPSGWEDFGIVLLSNRATNWSVGPLTASRFYRFAR